MIRIIRAPDSFSDWQGLLALLRECFAYMDDRIDPPSSLHRLTAQNIAEKAKAETLLLAMSGDGELVGCLFARRDPDKVYLSKLAVTERYRRLGLGRELVDAVIELARSDQIDKLELQVRIELIENQKTFSRLGFVQSGTTRHAEYDRPTSVTMTRLLSRS